MKKYKKGNVRKFFYLVIGLIVIYFFIILEKNYMDVVGYSWGYSY